MMADCSHSSFPVMVSFQSSSGSINSVNSFQLIQPGKDEKLESVLLKNGPEDWASASPQNIKVKVSAARSGSFDKFSLNNTVGLISQVLKTDVLWIIFEKVSVPVLMPSRNAFDVLRAGAVEAASKGLPSHLPNPFHQKQELFNKLLDYFRKNQILFNKSDCGEKGKHQPGGAATELVYDLTNIVWKVGQSEKQLENRSLWSKVPQIIRDLVDFKIKSKDPIQITQQSARNFAVSIREVASKALMTQPKLNDLKIGILNCAEIFLKYSDYLQAQLEAKKKKSTKEMSVSTAAEAIILQISNREKVSLREPGSKPLSNPVVKSIFNQLREKETYDPLNISTLLPTNRYSRSTILHRDLPNQAPERIVLWTFDNGPTAPQSIFAFKVDKSDTPEIVLEKTNDLKSKLQSMQKFYYPREFYKQFYDQIGLVTGISSQDLKLVCSMVMGDERKFDGLVKERFEEAVMSGDIYDLRHFNGSDIKYKDFVDAFRAAVQEYMVEDRGRHEMQYDGSIISKVSVGFSLKQMFKEVCDKVKAKNPDCPLPKSEGTIARYLIPRTRSAAETACRSEPLIPLRLATQQKVIEKPNIDAHYNAAMYKYLKSYAVDLGSELVTVIGWDDKTGVDVGEPEQPTAATQHTGKSWVHNEVTVGEGQHSFHKTNLTPSVRLVHEIGETVEDSFYRGLPQVVIKDAIFEPSNSARHATELFQMLQSNPHLIKPVLILSNDGGVDHTIRHERNIVSLLALFLRLPDVQQMTVFQFAAYRSAYHPVEKLNCILNLCWNGVCLSREPFEDPVLENVFKQCGSMNDVRKQAQRHSGIREALQKSLEPSVDVLEKRAQQASLKENYFETFKPATEDEVKEFLSIVLEIDPSFNVEKFQDKTKPFHFSPILKSYIEKRMTSTYYTLTYSRDSNMTKEFLSQNFPSHELKTNLEPIPCPIVDPENPERFLSYDKIKNLSNKDFSDKCRPGKNIKLPSNIPFKKSKPRAIYGANVSVVCDLCNKQRAVYFEYKPSKHEIMAAKNALHNVRYICGGRISGFGRSLSMMEEIGRNISAPQDISDEVLNDVIEESNADMEPILPKASKKKMIIESDSDDDSCVDSPTLNMELEDEFDCYEDSPEDIEEKNGSTDEACLDLLRNPEQSMEVSEGGNLNELSPKQNNNAIFCYFCKKFETWHTCKTCKVPCCNFCNKVTEMEDLLDFVCPNCEVLSTSNTAEIPKSRGRPRNSEKEQNLQPLGYINCNFILVSDTLDQFKKSKVMSPC